MKINQIILKEMGTVAGAVATVAKPMGETQKRPEVAGLQPAEKVMSGKAKKKGPYQNSLSEGKNRTESVKEAKLDEDDIIVVPGTKMKRKTGFVQHGQSRVDHEVEMARSDVLATMKNAKAIYKLLQNRSEEEGIEGWVQEKLIKANDYLNAVKEYYDEKMMQEAGVIAGGGVGEGVAEGLMKDIKRLATGKDAKSRAGQEISKAQQASMTGDNKTASKHFKRYDKLDKLANKEQGVAEGSKVKTAKGYGDVVQGTDVKTIAKADLGKNKLNLPQGYGDVVQPQKLKTIAKAKGVAEGQLQEKAVSKAQQKFFGMAHAMQKGAKIKGASKELKDVAKSMSKGDVKDFAKTKHKGLPQHVAKKD